jgi:hypothetical protein
MARLAEVGVSLTSLQPHATPNDVLIDVIQSQKEIIDNQSESIQIQSVQLDELEVRVEAADEFVEVANETIMSYADEVKNANSLLKELTETNKALRFHLERKGVDSDDYDFVDPDRTLKLEIDVKVRELAELAGAPQVRNFSIGRSFGESLDSQGSKTRDKAIRTCSFLVVNDRSLTAQLDDHPLRSSSGGGTSSKKRTTDRASARRCAIEKNTPQALRLHYWELKGLSPDQWCKSLCASTFAVPTSSSITLGRGEIDDNLLACGNDRRPRILERWFGDRMLAE